MTPDDLTTVRRSWTELRRRRVLFLARLEAALDPIAAPTTAAEHARRLVAAAEELVDALATPSELAARARAVATAWPPRTARPRLDVDGVAWRQAASEVCLPWSDADDAGWHHAWLLLADVLAADSSAWFDGPGPTAVVPSSPPT